MTNTPKNNEYIYVNPFLAYVYFPRQKITENTYVCLKSPCMVRIASGIGLPYGGYARLVFLDLLRRARIQQSPHINLGSSLDEYVRELGLRDDEHIVNQIKDNLFRLATTSFSLRSYRQEIHPLSKTLGTMEGQVNFYICENGSFWSDDHPEKIRQHYWKWEITLTDEMFKLARLDGYPVNFRYFPHLVNDTFAFDLLLWMTWRIGSLSKTDKPSIEISLETLGGQFYPSTPDFDQYEFKRKLRNNVKILFEINSELEKFISFDARGNVLVITNTPNQR